jgi:membrane-bound lytic murein transglycosylase D
MKNQKITLIILPLFFLILLISSFAFAEPNIKTLSEPQPILIQKRDDISENHLSISTLEDKQDGLQNAPLNISYKSNESAIKAVERSIKLFTEKIRDRFSVWLERSAKYINIMKDILKEKGMPEDLVFLPIIESGFNPNAYSPANASGPWQFITSTAKRYGLIIDWWRDERKDPIKSTHAAALYLKDLYNMFGSWKLALAAYNAGEGRIGRAIKRSENDDFWYLKENKKIPKETQEYVPMYIAASMIASSPEDYGFYDLVYHEPLMYDEVSIKSPMDIELIALCAETTVKEIRELNPELRRWSTPPNIKEYTIRIPYGSKEIFLENLSKIPEDKRFSYDTYLVKKGDTFKKISRKTGVPIEAILALNSLTGLEKPKAGDKLKLPPAGKYYADIIDKKEAKKSLKIKKTLVNAKQTRHKNKAVRSKNI